MLEKIKGLWRDDDVRGGGGPAAVATAPSARLIDTLKVFGAESPELEQRVLAYVHAGSGPEVVAELAARPRPGLDELLGKPGLLQPWFGVSGQLRSALHAAHRGWTIAKSRDARQNLYTLSDGVRVDQLVRLARVLHAVAQEVDRATEAFPGWFTLLVNDVCKTGQRTFQPKTGTKRGQAEPWSVDLLAQIAREGGVAEADVTACVLVSVLERTSEQYRNPAAALLHLPGVPELVVADAATATRVAGLLSAAGRAALCDLATDHPEVAVALPDLFAMLAVDPAKTVRERVVPLFGLLPAARQKALAAPLLTTVPVTRVGMLVTHLTQVEGGADTVAGALDAVREAPRQGARVTLLEGALGRVRALDGSAPKVERVTTPPFEPIPEVPLGDDVAKIVRAAFDEVLARERAELTRLKGVPKDERWSLPSVEGTIDAFSKVTDAQVRRALDHLGGQSVKVDALALRCLGEPTVVRKLRPQLTLLHQLRLANAQMRRHRGEFPVWALGSPADLDIDLRIVADAVSRSCDWDPEPVIDNLALRAWWGDRDLVRPEHAWAYYAEHQERLEMAFGLRPGAPEHLSLARSLDVLSGFPEIPSVFLPRLAELALGTTRTHRAAAQGILASHAGARVLAEEGLRSSTADIRATAADWLRRLGDPAAVPALRGLLGTERRETVRAAVLTALEALGDDIAPDLAPDVLLAEARKGLRAKAPASMSWFDLDSLPVVHWASDGTAVPVEVLRWWVVLAVKLKDPSGLGLLARYVGLLAPGDQAALGRHVLATWVAQDTRNPSADESRAHAEAEAPRWYDRVQEWARRHPQYYEAEAAKSVDDHYRTLYRQHQATYLGSAIKDKGLLALTVGMPGTELAETFTRYTKAHFTRRAQIEALVHALAANGEPAAVQSLLGVSRRFRQATVQETAVRLVTELAERRGWTADQLTDRTVQTAGFEDDGLLHLELGSREYVGRITPTFTLELTNEAGKVVKALPAPRVDDDADVVKAAKSQLSTSRKELKAVVAAQTQRLYEAMCVGRTWTAEEWTEFVLGHPIMSRLAAGLVWVENPGDGQRVFRPGDDGALIGVDDEDVELAAGSVVGLAHVVHLDAADAAAWREHLADYEVRPLFDQLGVTLPELAPDTREVTDHEGWFSDSFSIRGRATKRGYTRSYAEDGGWFTSYTKPYPSIGVQVEIEFTGSYLPEENIAAAVTQLVFRRTDRLYDDVGVLAIADVPAALVAESYRDYVHVAEAGSFDADWERKSQW